MFSFIDLPLSNEKLLPFILQAPTLELKPLPDHLKYVFLGEEDTLPVIIAKELTPLQEERLIRVLRKHKTTIRWTIADIKRISPSICVITVSRHDLEDHKIKMESPPIISVRM